MNAKSDASKEVSLMLGATDYAPRCSRQKEVLHLCVAVYEAADQLVKRGELVAAVVVVQRRQCCKGRVRLVATALVLLPHQRAAESFEPPSSTYNF